MTTYLTALHYHRKLPNRDLVVTGTFFAHTIFPHGAQTLYGPPLALLSTPRMESQVKWRATDRTFVRNA